MSPLGFTAKNTNKNDHTVTLSDLSNLITFESQKLIIIFGGILVRYKCNNVQFLIIYMGAIWPNYFYFGKKSGGVLIK
jgi:hypothetical protein